MCIKSKIIARSTRADVKRCGIILRINSTNFRSHITIRLVDLSTEALIPAALSVVAISFSLDLSYGLS